MDRIIQRESWCGFVVGRLSMTRWTTSQRRRLFAPWSHSQRRCMTVARGVKTMNEFSQVQKQKQGRNVRKWHCLEECQKIASQKWYKMSEKSWSVHSCELRSCGEFTDRIHLYHTVNSPYDRMCGPGWKTVGKLGHFSVSKLKRFGHKRFDMTAVTNPGANFDFCVYYKRESES